MAAAPLPQIWLQGSSAGGLCRGTAGEGAGAAASLGVQAAVVDREAESVWWREMPGQGSVPSLGDSGGGVGGAVTAHAEEHCPGGAANTGVGVGGQPPAAWGNGAVTGTGLCRPLEGTRAAAAVWPLLRSSLHGGGGGAPARARVGEQASTSAGAPNTWAASAAPTPRSGWHALRGWPARGSLGRPSGPSWAPSQCPVTQKGQWGYLRGAAGSMAEASQALVTDPSGRDRCGGWTGHGPLSWAPWGRPGRPWVASPRRPLLWHRPRLSS